LVKHRMEEIEKDRQDRVLKKLTEQERQVQMSKEKQVQEGTIKKEVKSIQREDRVENVQRIARAQEFQRQKMLEKIEEDNAKARKIKEDMQKLLETRKRLRAEADMQKQAVLANFERLKKEGNLRDVDLDALTSPKAKTSRKAKSRSQMVGSRSEIDLNNRSGNNPRSSSQIGTRGIIETGHFESGSNSSGGTYREKKTGEFRIKSQHTPKGRKVVGLGKQKKKNAGSVVQVSREEAEKQIEELRKKQNKEFVAILTEEQMRESEREDKLKACKNENDRKTLDTQFGLERAKASQKIVSLSQRHEENLSALKKQTGYE